MTTMEIVNDSNAAADGDKDVCQGQEMSVLVESPPCRLGNWLSPPDNRALVWLSRVANVYWQNGIVTGLFPLAVHMFWAFGGKEIAECQGLTILFVMLTTALAESKPAQHFVTKNGKWEIGLGCQRVGRVPVFPIGQECTGDIVYGLYALIMTVVTVGKMSWGVAGGCESDVVSGGVARAVVAHGGHVPSFERTVIANGRVLSNEEAHGDDNEVPFLAKLRAGTHQVLSKLENLRVVSFRQDDRVFYNGHNYGHVSRMMVGNWESWVYQDTVQMTLLARFKAFVDLFRSDAAMTNHVRACFPEDLSETRGFVNGEFVPPLSYEREELSQKELSQVDWRVADLGVITEVSTNDNNDNVAPQTVTQ